MVVLGGGELDLEKKKKKRAKYKLMGEIKMWAIYTLRSVT